MGYTLKLILVLNFLKLLFLIVNGDSIDEAISVQAMGRPFTLGMLYDGINDQLLPGLSLWNEDEIKASTDSTEQIYTSVSMKSIESKKDKADLLDLTADLALSVYDGKISVTGSAHYLNDQASSSQQISFGFEYTSTSRYEELTMNALKTDKMTYLDDVPDSDATHVVTGIMFGNQVVFDFSKAYSSEEDASTVAGELQVQVSGFEAFELNANASIEITDEQKAETSDITVKFFGDFIPDFIPTSYEEALEVYLNIPNYLSADTNSAVPTKVWLYPLNKLNSRAKAIINELDDVILESFESIFNDLDDAVVQCADYMSVSEGIFPSFYDQVSDLKDMIYTYKLDFQVKVSDIISEHKANTKTSDDVETLITDHNASPFGYLDRILGMYKILSSALSEIATDYGSILVEDASFFANLVDVDMEDMVYLKVDTDIQNTERWLEEVENYLEDSTTSVAPLVVSDSLINLVHESKIGHYNFYSFYDTNRDSDVVGLHMMVQESDFDTTGDYKVGIYAMSSGDYSEASFTVPDAPGTPVKTTDAIEWSSITSTKIQYYILYYKSVDSGSWTSDEKTVTNSNKIEWTKLSDILTAGKMYYFKVKGKIYDKPYFTPFSEESDAIYIAA